MVTRFQHELVGIPVVEGGFGFVAGVVGRRHFGDENFRETVVVEVGHIGAHGTLADLGHALFQYFGKSAVAVIVVQVVAFEKVVGDKQVLPAVAVVIAHGYAEAEPDSAAVDAGGLSDIGEAAAAVSAGRAVIAE